MPFATRTRRAAAIALAASLLLLPRVSRAQSAVEGDDDPAALGAARVAGQLATGVLGTPVGFVAGGIGTRWVARSFGAKDETAATWGYIGAWTGSALTTAVGPTLVGSRGAPTGSYAAAVGGAIVGGLGSWLLVRLNDRDDGTSGPCHLRCILSTAAIVVLPSVGATVAFDLTRRYR